VECNESANRASKFVASAFVGSKTSHLDDKRFGFAECFVVAYFASDSGVINECSVHIILTILVELSFCEFQSLAPCIFHTEHTCDSSESFQLT